MSKVVFIMAPGHSGSTLMDLILGSHNQAFSLGELWAAPMFMGRASDGEPALCGICATKCDFWNQPHRLEAVRSYFKTTSEADGLRAKLVRRIPNFSGNIYELLVDWSGAGILIDSSKNVWWIKRQLRPSWHWRSITPYVLFLSRDGRAVTNSLLRKYPSLGMETAAKDWARTVRKMERFYMSFPADRRIRLSYEALTTWQEPTVRTLCEWLQIPYEPAMLAYWKHAHHLIDGNLGTRMAVLQHRARTDRTALDYWTHRNADQPQIDRRYYDDQGMSVALDLRWKRELTESQIRVFDSIAGSLNERFAWSIE